MIEKFIFEHSTEYTTYKMWKSLSKKIKYKTFKLILDYLELSGKILIDKDNIIIWTYDPKIINKVLYSEVKLR